MDPQLKDRSQASACFLANLKVTETHSYPPGLPLESQLAVPDSR